MNDNYIIRIFEYAQEPEYTYINLDGSEDTYGNSNNCMWQEYTNGVWHGEFFNLG